MTKLENLLQIQRRVADEDVAAFTVSGVLALIMGAACFGSTTPKPILSPASQESLPSPILS